MTDVQWLLLLLSLLIIVPVIWSVTMGLLRKRDFKRQIEGKTSGTQSKRKHEDIQGKSGRECEYGYGKTAV